ncbi:MAG: TIM barrel protein [Kiritimatiellaeota bacterium]|nr:TIM barrel protein [Kiritimatiellota bacterium]
MKFGGPLLAEFADPADWVAGLEKLAYTATPCPLKPGASSDTIRAYADAARRAGIAIAEVGAWSNPLSPNAEIRRRAIDHCRDCLALADEIGARCCVNIAGSRGAKWDGPCPEDLSPETFDMIVETVRDIVDAVRPIRTFYTLETMPWMIPNSVETYERILEAVDRPRFAVHFDPVNLINSPERYFRNGALVREFVQKLGDRIRSVHAKDIVLRDRLTVHLDEVRPGLGGLDYRCLLTELERGCPAAPVMMEHLPNAEEYAAAAAYIRQQAHTLGFDLT